MGEYPGVGTVPTVSGLLALKLFLSPVLVGGATWIQQRWSHAIGGRVIGLPLTTGPFLLIVALQEGRSYAASAAHGIVAGQFALALFTYVYALTVRRLKWWQSLGAATLVELSTTVVISRFTPNVMAVMAIIFIVIVAALRFWPPAEPQVAPMSHPKWELPARIFTALVIIVTLSALAQLLGPILAGALATYPVIISVLGAFTQRRYGADGVINTLRGLMQSLPITVVLIGGLALTL